MAIDPVTRVTTTAIKNDAMGELTGAVKIVSSLTRRLVPRTKRYGRQLDSLCLDDWTWRVGAAKILYEDLDDGSEDHGSWVAEREIANARHAASLAYIGTLDGDAAPYSIPILNETGPC